MIFFKVISIGCHGNQRSPWNSIILAILKKDHPMIIPAKFGLNTTNVSEVDVICNFTIHI
jgi:hypothetical protein